jgi:hypothetical protein
MVYEGEWVNDKLEGKGTMIYPSGKIYEGSWAADIRHGEGKMTYPSGAVREGVWLNNENDEESDSE